MNEILTKVCFKCNEEKPITEFYKHKQMSLGVVNKCKVCNKNDVKKDYYRKAQNKEWLDKERERQREKYKRLNYCKKQKEWNANKPWTKSPKLKNLNRKFKVPKGIQLHHWNYNDEYLEDVFLLEIKQHRRAHIHLTLDIEKRIFKNDKGEYLDTKEKHLIYLLSKGIKF